SPLSVATSFRDPSAKNGSAIATESMSACAFSGAPTWSPAGSRTAVTPGSLHGSGGGGGGQATQGMFVGQEPERSTMVLPAMAEMPASCLEMYVPPSAPSSVYVMNDEPSTGLTSISNRSSSSRLPAQNVPSRQTMPLWTK